MEFHTVLSPNVQTFILKKDRHATFYVYSLTSLSLSGFFLKNNGNGFIFHYYKLLMSQKQLCWKVKCNHPGKKKHKSLYLLLPL